MSTVAIVVKKEAYNAGETIDGHVLCDFKSAKFINEIILSIKGESFVRFTEYGWENKNWKKYNFFDRIHFLAKEVFFNDSIKLFGEGDESVSKFVTSGVYLYPFSYTLLEHLPTTFIGIDFRIWYELKVTIVHQSNKRYETSFIFDVIDPIDLNLLNINFLRPVFAVSEIELRKINGTCGVFKLDVEIPKTGIAVKEALPIECYITNPFKLYVKKLRANLIQIIEYCSVSPERHTRRIQRIIAINQLRHIGRECEYSARLKLKVREPFRVPNLNQLPFIRVEYKIEVLAITTYFNKCARCFIPITYGHIPVKEPEIKPKKLEPQSAGLSPSHSQQSLKMQIGEIYNGRFYIGQYSEFKLPIFANQ